MVALNRNYGKPPTKEEYRPMIPKKTYTPLLDYVAIHEIKDSGLLDSGLAVPEQFAAQVKTPTAWVVAVGPDCKQVKADDQDLDHRRSGRHLRYVRRYEAGSPSRAPAGRYY